MYYDYIIKKMIPGIFIVINNKTTEGYIDTFSYIKNYINISSNINDNIRAKTFTTDFEVGLINAFNFVFNKKNNISHIGCYFHFLQNIRKYLQKHGFTCDKYTHVYNLVMNICKTLPCISLKGDKLENYIKEKFKKYIFELNDFILYFKQTGLNSLIMNLYF